MKKSILPAYKEIEINNQLCIYKLKYSKKAKYLRLQISRGNQLEVILPRGYQLKEAENFIKKKSDWIEKHLAAKKAEPEFLYFGNEIKVKEYFQLFITKHKISFKDGFLEIRSPEESNVPLNDLYNSWLKHNAKKYLLIRVDELAARLGFNVNRVSIRGQKTRWGSCSSGSNLSFNYRLLRFRKEVIDYVIIHELCHLKEMNHSPNFWSLVQFYCENYKQLRKELKGR